MQIDTIQELQELALMFKPSNKEREDKIAEMYFALATGNKIPAIKIHRSLSGLGLKESKDFVEYEMNRLSNQFAKYNY